MCFFFNDTATTEIYTLSLHDALPICPDALLEGATELGLMGLAHQIVALVIERRIEEEARSEEHTSELQSRQYLVCRLLLEKKNKTLHFDYAESDQTWKSSRYQIKYRR